MLTGSVSLTAQDKLEEAIIAFENGNYRDAYKELEKVNDRATEAFNLAQDNDSRVMATKLKLVALLLGKVS